MKTEELGPEVKYSPTFFVNDFTALSSMLQEKARLIGQLDFSDAQKAQISGTLMMMSVTLTSFLGELKKWGIVL